MFTIEQIKAAHSKVKSGADFPNYVQEIILLGVKNYETFVSDGNTLYKGANNYETRSGAKYVASAIADHSNKDQFIKDIRAHQQGKTDFLTFCKQCANTGVEKWIVDLEKMTCTYYDKAGDEIMTEVIPG